MVARSSRVLARRYGRISHGDGMATYHRPKTVRDALELIAQDSAANTPYAGGTDLLLLWSRGLARRPESLVELKGIEALRGISRANGEICVGACTRVGDIESDPVIRSSAPVLAQASGRVACPQVRNRATIGGNLCNASPAADTAVPLILLDAVLDLASAREGGMAVRQVPITEFFRGPGSTVLVPGEILTCIRFKPLPEGAFAAWDKFGTRPAMEIAVASVGVVLQVDAGVVAHARVGYGSVAPVPMRGGKAEAELTGNALSEEIIGRCVGAAREEISPITDVRASEAYRREVVAVMLRRMLERADRA